MKYIIECEIDGDLRTATVREVTPIAHMGERNVSATGVSVTGIEFAILRALRNLRGSSNVALWRVVSHEDGRPRTLEGAVKLELAVRKCKLAYLKRESLHQMGVMFTYAPNCFGHVRVTLGPDEIHADSGREMYDAALFKKVGPALDAKLSELRAAGIDVPSPKGEPADPLAIAAMHQTIERLYARQAAGEVLDFEATVLQVAAQVGLPDISAGGVLHGIFPQISLKEGEARIVKARQEGHVPLIVR